MKAYAIYTSALIVVYRMLTRSRLMSRQEHLVMVQSFVGNAADMNEFLIASYKGSTHHRGFNIFYLLLGRFEYKSMSFAVWLWASLQFCFSCTSEQGF